MMNWFIGNVEISRIVEIEALEFPSEFVAGGVSAEQVLAVDWMKPHFCNAEGQSSQAVLSRFPGADA